VIILCAWCGKNLGEKEPLEDKSITHGICKECKKQLLADLNKKDIERKFRAYSL